MSTYSLPGIGDITIDPSTRTGCKYEGYINSSPKRKFLGMTERDVETMIVADYEEEPSHYIMRPYVYVREGLIKDIRNMTQSDANEEQVRNNAYYAGMQIVLAYDYCPLLANMGELLSVA